VIFIEVSKGIHAGGNILCYPFKSDDFTVIILDRVGTQTAMNPLSIPCLKPCLKILYIPVQDNLLFKHLPMNIFNKDIFQKFNPIQLLFVPIAQKIHQGLIKIKKPPVLRGNEYHILGAVKEPPVFIFGNF